MQKIKKKLIFLKLIKKKNDDKHKSLCKYKYIDKRLGIGLITKFKKYEKTVLSLLHKISKILL